ncbi:MAG: methyltransferase domain-containing protein [archaeon]|nr:MAG: methyltransferase domain-containing protein [archaeon]
MKIECIPPTGIKKYPKIERILRNLKNREKINMILDGGGTDYSYYFLKKIFPKSKIISLNLNKKEMANVHNPFIGSVENLSKKFKKGYFDLIFLCDTLEHLFSPEKFIEGARHCLKEGGHLLISTPNLASIYNRFFILLGFSPSNYHSTGGPCIGNPFMRERFGGEHKSVFTYSGLKHWMQINRFEIVALDGFDYGNVKRTSREEGGRYKKIRKLINDLVPLSMKEGIIILCKKE